MRDINILKCKFVLWLLILTSYIGLMVLIADKKLDINEPYIIIILLISTIILLGGAAWVFSRSSCLNCIMRNTYCSICEVVTSRSLSCCPPYNHRDPICTQCYTRRQIAREVSNYVNNPVSINIPNIILNYSGDARVGSYEIPVGVILDNFPSLESEHNKHSQDVCPICIETKYYGSNYADEVPSDNMSLVLKCGHIMHIKCIKYDIKECPLCKAPTSPII